MPTPFVGRPLRRLEDPRLLRGRGTYLDDLRVPRLAHVAFVRSIHPHARFRVDAAAARGADGVMGVFVAGDVPTARGANDVPAVVAHPALRACQHPLLARDRVRYVGEAIAAIVATDRYAAVGSVRVEYDPLPPVADAARAMAPDAPILHEDLGNNLAADFTDTVGDVDAAFRSADVVIRGRYCVQRYSGGG